MGAYEMNVVIGLRLAPLGRDIAESVDVRFGRIVVATYPSTRLMFVSVLCVADPEEEVVEVVLDEESTNVLGDVPLVAAEIELPCDGPNELRVPGSLDVLVPTESAPLPVSALSLAVLVIMDAPPLVLVVSAVLLTPTVSLDSPSSPSAEPLGLTVRVASSVSVLSEVASVLVAAPVSRALVLVAPRVPRASVERASLAAGKSVSFTARAKRLRCMGWTTSGLRPSICASLSEFGMAFSAYTMRAMAMQKSTTTNEINGHRSGVGL